MHSALDACVHLNPQPPVGCTCTQAPLDRTLHAHTLNRPPTQCPCECKQSKLDLRRFDVGTQGPRLSNFRVAHLDDEADMKFFFDIDWDWDCEIEVYASKGVCVFVDQPCGNPALLPICCGFALVEPISRRKQSP